MAKFIRDKVYDPAGEQARWTCLNCDRTMHYENLHKDGNCGHCRGPVVLRTFLTRRFL